VLKSKIAAALFAAAMMLQVGAVSFAEDNGPWTTNHPFVWGVGSFPFRLLTGGVGAGFGAVAGGAKGIVETERKFAENTWGEADKNPLMVPVGLVGTVVAVPVGIIMGAPQGAVKMGTQGYNWWNRF
jgi:hypothetical protein